MSIKRIARYGQKGFMPSTECVKDLLRVAQQADVEEIIDKGYCS
jgi:hypothetical protein